MTEIFTTQSVAVIIAPPSSHQGVGGAAPPHARVGFERIDRPFYNAAAAQGTASFRSCDLLGFVVRGAGAEVFGRDRGVGMRRERSKLLKIEIEIELLKSKFRGLCVVAGGTHETPDRAIPAAE